MLRQLLAKGYVDPNHPSPNTPGDTGIIIYGYIPSLALSIVAVVSFGFCAITALGLLYRFRWNWMVFLTLVGTLFEVAGYIGRSLSSQVDPYRLAFFVVQYFFIVVAPVFFAAAIYLAFGRLIQLVGSKSPVRPKWVLGVFVAFDVVTTIMQIAGAALIGSYESANKDPSVPNDILLAGLAIQLASFAIFLVILGYCVTIFLRLPSKDSTGFKQIMWLFAWLTAVGMLVQLRTAFRLAETSQNVFGYLSTHEVFFAFLEYLPIILAVIGLLWLSECIRKAMSADLNISGVEVHGVSSQATGVSSPV